MPSSPPWPRPSSGSRGARPVAVAAHRCADDTRDRALDRLTALSRSSQSARDSRADLVLGLADLQDWVVDEAARRAYDDLIETGIRGGQHDHVYAANLAVSWPAFVAVGGFPG